jgi:hypothetical protein
MAVAKLAAIKAVKRDMQAQGLRTAHIERQTIVSAAYSYLRDHPELIELAAETVRKVPQLRTLAEREVRRCEGKMPMAEARRTAAN